jgi:hypothetical protein
MITNEDFGCLSKVHSDSYSAHVGTGTHCWQAGEPCADLQFINLTAIETDDYEYPGLDFCSEGIIVQTSRNSDESSVQSTLLTRLTGDQTAHWGSPWSPNFSFSEGVTTSSSFTMDYINATGLGPVLTGVAASLTQQALLANTSEIFKGTVLTTETYVAVDWP